MSSIRHGMGEGIKSRNRNDDGTECVYLFKHLLILLSLQSLQKLLPPTSQIPYKRSSTRDTNSIPLLSHRIINNQKAHLDQFLNLLIFYTLFYKRLMGYHDRPTARSFYPFCKGFELGAVRGEKVIE